MIGRLWRKLLGGSDTSQQAERGVVPSQGGGDEVTPEEVFHTAAARFLDVQVSTNDVLDNKTSNTFSIGSIVLPVTFGLLGLSGRKVPSEIIAILILALVGYLILVFCVWRASRNRAFLYRPNMLDLLQNSEVARGEVLRQWVASEYVASTEFNKDRLERKGIWLGRAITALYVEGFLLSIAAISTLL
jgi:hypothetical protein